MSSKKLLRHEASHAVFGSASDLPDKVLPTYEDVMRCLLFERRVIMDKNEHRQQPSVKDMARTVANKVIAVWKKASICDDAIISTNRIISMIVSHHDKGQLLKKSINKGGVYAERVIEFQRKAASTLFDICACKCSDPTTSCSCEIRKKIPKIEIPFLLDQRGNRKMQIGSVDLKTTKVLQERERRRRTRETYVKAHCSKEVLPYCAEPGDVSSSDHQITSDTDSDFEIPKSSYQQMRTSLPNLASAAYPANISTRKAAFIASSVLADLNIISPEDPRKVIDHNKVRREQKTLADQIVKEKKSDLQQNRIKGLYFDGKIDKTLVLRKADDSDRLHRKEEREDHVVLIQEPRSEYIGHVTPASGHGHAISKAILHYFEENDVDTSDLTVIGCDGTTVNTGTKNGALSHIEHSLKRPLQRLICLLHCNELPLRHLIEDIDGKSKGPKSYRGPIGEFLDKCQNLPINVSWPSEFNKFEDLSTDQKYLLEMCQAVSSGTCSTELARRDPGNMCQSRWLTTANRVLRLYVTTESPSKELCTIANYVMRVYAPTWFYIKFRPSCSEGAKHFWRLIKFSRYLEETHKKIIDPVLRRNAFFAHPENLLIAMINDTRGDIRCLGWRRILKARDAAAKVKTSNVRMFQVPQLVLDADDYTSLFDWSIWEPTEPPLTMNLSRETLLENIRNKAKGEDFHDDFPCHTQAVERAVQVVSEASASVCGPEARHRFVMAKLVKK